MENNRIPMTENEEPKSVREELAESILKEVQNASRLRRAKIFGQLVVEVEGCPPLPMSLLAQPDGGFLLWFLDGDVFRLSALVNESIRRIASIPVENHQELQDLLFEIQKEMGEEKIEG